MPVTTDENYGDLKPDLEMVGRRIRECREALGYSQQQFANKLATRGVKITQGGIGHWEFGRSDLATRTLSVVANILRVDASYLIGQKDEDFSDAEVSRLYKTLGPAQADVVREVVRALAGHHTPRITD